jgi:hypothetical protein
MRSYIDVQLLLKPEGFSAPLSCQGTILKAMTLLRVVSHICHTWERLHMPQCMLDKWPNRLNVYAALCLHLQHSLQHPAALQAILHTGTKLTVRCPFHFPLSENKEANLCAVDISGLSTGRVLMCY